MMNSTPSWSWKDNEADYEYENLYEYLREKSRIPGEVVWWKKKNRETRILL